MVLKTILHRKYRLTWQILIHNSWLEVVEYQWKIFWILNSMFLAPLLQKLRPQNNQLRIDIRQSKLNQCSNKLRKSWKTPRPFKLKQREVQVKLLPQLKKLNKHSKLIFNKLNRILRLWESKCWKLWRKLKHYRENRWLNINQIWKNKENHLLQLICQQAYKTIKL